MSSKTIGEEVEDLDMAVDEECAKEFEAILNKYLKGQNEDAYIKDQVDSLTLRKQQELKDELLVLTYAD